MKKVLAIMLAAATMLSIAPVTAAKDADPNARGYYKAFITDSSGNTYGLAEMDFGYSYEPGAYATATRTSSSTYYRAAVKLTSYDGSSIEYATAYAYNSSVANTYISVNYAADTVLGEWAVCGESVQPGDPEHTHTADWIV